MAQLIVTLTDGRTQTFELGAGSYLVGRDPSCDLVLDDSSASRRHVRLHCENGLFYIEDLGSKNGTLVNNQAVQSAKLNHQDVILIGSVEAQFHGDTLQRPSTVVVEDGRGREDTTHYTSRSESLVLTERRLQMLYDLSERLTSLRDQHVLLEDALDICFETLRFERGCIGVRKQGSRGIDWPVVRNLRGTSGELTISRTILGRALDHGERAIIADSGGPIDPTVSMVQHGIRSAMCVPMKSEEEILGVIYGDQVSRGTTYSKEDVDFFAGIARQVAIGLINARLLESQKERLAMEAELAVAREIQQQLFPRELPESNGINLAAINEPGRTVSGDYYDIIHRPDGRIAFLIADVSGKGVAASLLMSNLQAAVRMTLPTCEDLGVVVGRWNELMYSNTDVSKFVTCLAGIIDPRARRLIYVSAGHHLPHIVSGGNVRAIPQQSEPEYPLGIAPGVHYTATEFEFDQAPCLIFVYTDGVIEAMDMQGNQFGESRMEAILLECAEEAPGAVLRRMRKAITSFCRDAPQSDDITMIAAKLM